MQHYPQPARHALSRVMFSLASMLAVAGALVPIIDVARADYTPPAGPYNHVVGANGAQVQNQGTPLSPTDALGAWNSWTGTSKLSSGTSCAGVCIIYANSGATLYYTSCVVPYPASGAWADVRVAAGTSENNLGCTSLGSDANPIFVVNYYSAPSYGYLHVQRHEMAHALGLNETSTTCWTWWVGYKPLMNNGTFGTCSGFPYNYTASENEVAAVISRNGW